MIFTEIAPRGGQRGHVHPYLKDRLANISTKPQVNISNGLITVAVAFGLGVDMSTLSTPRSCQPRNPAKPRLADPHEGAALAKAAMQAAINREDTAT